MSDANKKQYGGSHYQSGLQHWDVMGDHFGLAYYIGCATKYVSRWKKKGTPLLDLDKALHFTEKAREKAVEHPEDLMRLIAGKRPSYDLIERFVIANDLEMQERLVLHNLWRVNGLGCFDAAIIHIEALIREASRAKSGPAKD